MTDLTPLLALNSLEFLDLSGNPVERWPDRMDMSRLRHLRWKAHPTRRLENVRLLAGCEGLEVLTLSKHALADAEGLRPLGNLRVLDLDNNRLQDLGPLASLPGLQQLDVAANGIRSFAPLAGRQALTQLSVAGNPIEDLPVLGNLNRLEVLDISRTPRC